VALAALVGGAGAFGCAALLGFEDTTLREGSEGGVLPGEDGGTTDGGGPPDAGSSAISVTPARPVLRRGGSLELAVDVVRSGTSTGALTATLVDLPAGVVAEPLTIPPGTSKGVVKLVATAAAALGVATTRLTVTGASPELTPLEVPLLVADPAGAVDTTFDTDGVAIDATKALTGTFYALAVAGDGSIIAGGAGNGAAANAGWMLRRFSAAGAADAAFTTAAAPGLPTNNEIRAVAIDGTGRIVVAGASVPPIGAQAILTVARFTAAGALDVTFGGGVVRIPAAETPLGSSAFAVAVQTTGAIVVAGSRNDAAGQTGIVLRFTDTGARDTTFNAGATVTVADTRLVGIAIEPTGNMVIGGTTTQGSPAAYVVTRRTSTGGVDGTFGVQGVATFAAGSRANAFVRMPNGPFALAGDVRTGAAAYTAGLASPTGAPLFARSVTMSATGAFNALAAPDEATIIAAGHATGANGEARVERLLADGGAKDPAFGDAGTSLLDPGANGFDLSLFAAAIQKDGRILVGGNRSNAGAVIYRLWP